MKSDVVLRDVVEEDLPIFFQHQVDPEATRMAAFPARDHDAFMTHWAKLLADDTVIKKAILFRDQVAGSIVCFDAPGERLVGYWIGKEYWGRGIASHALAQLLVQVETRPLHARVAKHNVASIRVLEKCGFEVCGEDKVQVGGDEIEEFVMRLEKEDVQVRKRTDSR